MAIKSKDTGDVVVGNGEYMQSVVTINGANITLRTHIFTHVKLKGFTGGVSFLLVDINGNIINPPGCGGMVCYGVDGEDIFWGTSDRTETQQYSVDPGISGKTDQIIILQKWAPHNRLIVNEVVSVGGVVLDFLARLWQEGPVYNIDTSSDPYPSDPEDYTFESCALALVPKPAMLSVPTLVAPADGQRFSNYPRITSCSWNAVAGADSYKLTLQWAATDSNGVTTWFNTSIPWQKTTSMTVDFPGEGLGRWRITARDTTGAHQDSAPSVWRTFDYAPLPVLATPTLIAPPDGQRFSNYPRTTTLTWNSVSGATSYLVEVPYFDPAAKVWVDCIKQLVKGVSLTFSFVGSQPGRWRVTATDDTGAHLPSSPSAWRTFDYTPVQVLGVPTALSPADGQRFSNYPRTTKLEWQSVAGADLYNVEVQYGNTSASGTMWTPLYDKLSTPATSVTFDFVGSQPGRWRVSALDTTGAHQASPPCAWRTFDYSPVSSLATPKLLSPANGQHLPLGSVIVDLQWQAVPGATSYHVEVDSNPMFRHYLIPAGMSAPFAPLLERDIAATSLAITFLGFERARWRVTAVDKTGAHSASQPSAWWTFDRVPVTLPVSVTPAPVLITK